MRVFTRLRWSPMREMQRSIASSNNTLDVQKHGDQAAIVKTYLKHI